MKRSLIALISSALIFSLAACGADDSGADNSEATASETSITTSQESTTLSETEAGESESGTETHIADESKSVELLNQVWAAFGEDEQFPIAGGDMNQFVMGAAGTYSLEDPELVANILLFPAEQISQVDEAASLTHMMNSNTFTSGIFHMIEGADKNALSVELQDIVANNHWLCGFPEVHLIMSIADEYIVNCFGHTDNIENFKNHFLEQFDDAQVLYEEKIAG